MTEEQDPAALINCPMYQGIYHCKGILRYKGTFCTDPGTANGADRNHFTEYFVCDACGTKCSVPTSG